MHPGAARRISLARQNFLIAPVKLKQRSKGKRKGELRWNLYLLSRNNEVANARGVIFRDNRGRRLQGNCNLEPARPAVSAIRPPVEQKILALCTAVVKTP